MPLSLLREMLAGLPQSVYYGLTSRMDREGCQLQYLTLSEVAEALHLSMPTVKRYIYEGKLKSRKLPGGQHRIPQSEVDRLLALDQDTDSVGAAETGIASSEDKRLDVLERWVTELQSEIERLGAALEVVSRFCSRTAVGQSACACEQEHSKEHTILVLGSGCTKCNALYELVIRVVQGMGLENVRVEHVTDVDDITAFGPVLTPGLVIDQQLVMDGRVPNEVSLRQILEKHLR